MNIGSVDAETELFCARNIFRTKHTQQEQFISISAQYEILQKKRKKEDIVSRRHHGLHGCQADRIANAIEKIHF